MSAVEKNDFKERYANNRKIILENNLASDIHDRILDDNNMDLAAAFDDAVVWIAELYLDLESVKKHSSSGFIRRKPK
jgi:hypothetical protein